VAAERNTVIIENSNTSDGWISANAISLVQDAKDAAAASAPD